MSALINTLTVHSELQALCHGGWQYLHFISSQETVNEWRDHMGAVFEL